MANTRSVRQQALGLDPSRNSPNHIEPAAPEPPVGCATRPAVEAADMATDMATDSESSHDDITCLHPGASTHQRQQPCGRPGRRKHEHVARSLITCADSQRRRHAVESSRPTRVESTPSSAQRRSSVSADP